ncbi:DNA replication protein psf2 [Puccinia graminis f. sp. tritici]|uniref:DNA replication complex GINS protein PSF2 n=1 Tax=Puccinia graminis f. sp. tritici TaxID=56615 RepID=A0A5B0RU79_PUCGR|nr:DNA replication protein psf2 [Puccinia graminis f. sp. tritici]KAA1128044.1 DNA replication protein psf2 [Puccinia graminis f. sp. tritici]
MALPRFQRMTIEPKETVLMMIKMEKMEFIPNRKIAKFRNLDSEMIFEDLRPMKVTTLPVWLIIELKLKKLGKVVLPAWLSLVELKKLFHFEIHSPQLSELPYFWFEISKLLIEIAAEDIDSLEEIKKTLKDLKEVRQNKLRSSLKYNLSNQNQQTQQDRDYNFKNFLNHLEIPNLSHFELNEIRSTLTILNSKLQKFDNSSSSSNDNTFGNTFDQQASTSFSDPQSLRQDHPTLDNQTHSQFQFYSEPNVPPQDQRSTTARVDDLRESNSSVHDTNSST